ncbi:S-layer homology domain-containing protein [Agathobaculum desmolans]|uniref:S-layer homology domain-containing protein n=1 Tax=Agathobaculum desmolans TaxID=39484 RepID=UPI00248E406B|nr:S-layer homology domain-containing protein [Agathobaculum desmolans]
MKIVSWNVNGISRCRRTGFLRFLADTKPDILCCQEIKGRCPLKTPGYLQIWNPAKRPNYSGTLVVPIRITMPVPKNIDSDKLRILHYRTDGSHETIKYRLSEDKTTISFVVTHLSPFVFAEKADGVAVFVVTLVSDGKTVGTATVKENEKFILPEAPQKSNHTFTGWSDGAKTYKVNDEVLITEAVVFTAQWKYNGSSGGPSVPTYSATVNKAENGSVAVSPKNASKGAIVTVLPKPDTGYELDKLAVTDKDGKKVKLTDKGNGNFTFKMPSSKVTVEATFKKADESGKNTFTDVSSMDYFYDAVLWAAEKGVASGMTDSLFAPNASCTRAQMVTFLWRANGSPVVNYAMKFTDVPADGYYAEAVRWAVSEDITSGISETAFAPDMTVTRSQTVTFLYRAAGAPAVSGGSFADVDANAYYADAVAWAVAEDITSGTSETTFSPDAPCTRGQIVTFLYRGIDGTGTNF